MGVGTVRQRSSISHASPYWSTHRDTVRWQRVDDRPGVRVAVHTDAVETDAFGLGGGESVRDTGAEHHVADPEIIEAVEGRVARERLERRGGRLDPREAAVTADARVAVDPRQVLPGRLDAGPGPTVVR